MNSSRKKTQSHKLPKADYKYEPLEGQRRIAKSNTREMTTQLATHRADAEIYNGDALCKQKSQELLDQFFLPRGLLPLNDILEVGYNRTSGFIWLKQQKKKEHRFAAIGRTVLYDTEVTAFIEERRLRRLTGVKSKEFFLSITVSDIFIDEQNTSRITFGTLTGIAKSFPVSAFLIEEETDRMK